MTFVPSPQQAAIFAWTSTGHGSAFVEAVAGAGKTTTLVQMLDLTQGQVAFTAYNKKIADEIDARVPPAVRSRVTAGTFHKFGLKAWSRIHRGVKVDERAKSRQLVAELAIPPEIETFVLKLVSLAKSRAIGLFGSIDDESLWYDIIDHFDLDNEIEDVGLVKTGVELAIKTLKRSIELASTLIDFDDMIYMPVVTGCRMFEYDWVLVDEAQDTNPARRALARKMLRKGGRAVFVGDPHQAIYGFTGADADAIDQIIKDFNCTRLPLTVTYRCPQAVVRLAQRLVSHIQAHPSAPEGMVSQLDLETIRAQGWKPGNTPFHQTGDALLCRNTRPLVEVAYQLIRAGVPCHVEGKDIGQGLLKLVNRFSSKSLEQLRTKLEAFCEREREKLVAKGKETQAEALADRIETLFIIAEQCTTVDDLRTRITAMFLDANQEQRPTLTLSTVHKAKGREWDRVFLLGHDTLMPSPWARQAWQVQQETNLIYVAYTRAKRDLVLVSLPPAPARQAA